MAGIVCHIMHSGGIDETNAENNKRAQRRRQYRRAQTFGAPSNAARHHGNFGSAFLFVSQLGHGLHYSLIAIARAFLNSANYRRSRTVVQVTFAPDHRQP